MKQTIIFSVNAVVVVALMMWLTNCYFMSAVIAVTCAGLAHVLFKKQTRLSVFLFCAGTALVCFGIKGFEIWPAILNVFALALYNKTLNVGALETELDQE
ncbi:MAG: hypothetical protein J6Y91_01735 [Alphaproteobacteria bacterium]|nr:hypothetical protein [Alphaproteobacteria bacterium]MBP5352471.1 hypothetical protein [Alphaproteobacteria bacterium]